MSSGKFPDHFARPEKPGAIWVTLTAVGASNAP